MTTELRTSQVETLRAVEQGGRQGASIVDVAGRLSISERSARERLWRLWPLHLFASLPSNGPHFALTQLGHEALEGEG